MYKNDLIQVDQPFVDSVYLMLDKAPPRAPSPSPSPKKSSTPVDLRELAATVNLVNPDSPYPDWFTVGSATSTETGGSDDGFIIFNDWSRRGTKYPGEDMVLKQWKSFRSDIENPNTIASIVYIAKQQGADVGSVIKQFDEFELCKNEVIDPSLQEGVHESVSPSADQSIGNPLEQYSLKGSSSELEKSLVEAKLVLDQVAVMGELTAIYAAGGTGKTLIVLWLLIKAIINKKVDPNHVFYINADDSGLGLIQKLKLAELYGFHMLSPGHNGFKVGDFVKLIRGMTAGGQAQECVVILDTVKKFTSLMNKDKSSAFNEVLRGFAGKGGTVIAIAHTNKKDDSDGNPIPAGTSDMRDDFDSTYIGKVVSHDRTTGEKIVKITSDKIRIGGANELLFTYFRREDTDYMELFKSVKLIDEDALDSKKYEERMLEDGNDIEIIKQLIRDGIIGKMELAAEAAKLSGTSRKELVRIIDRYTGVNAARHHWNFIRKERGRMEYYLLDSDK